MLAANPSKQTKMLTIATTMVDSWTHFLSPSLGTAAELLSASSVMVGVSGGSSVLTTLGTAVVVAGVVVVLEELVVETVVVVIEVVVVVVVVVVVEVVVEEVVDGVMGLGSTVSLVTSSASSSS